MADDLLQHPLDAGGLSILNIGELLVGTATSSPPSIARLNVSASVASGAAAVWDGLEIMTSTATLTGSTTPVSAGGGFNAITIRAPVITAASAVVVTTAVTLKIDGAPTAAGSVTITNPYSLWVQGGSLFQTIYTGPSSASAPAYSFQATTNTGFFNPGGTSSLAISVGGTELLRFAQTTFNINIGTTVDTAATKFKIFLTKTVASAANATWDGFDIRPQTCTLSPAGTNVTIASGFNAVRIGTMALSAASATTVTHSAAFTVIAAPVGGGAGPCTITNPYAIWSQAGNNRFAEMQLDTDSRVAAQFDKTNTTLADVTGLTATLAAAGNYAFEAVLFVTAALLGGSKYAIAGTATATAIIYDIVLLDEATSLNTISARQAALAGAAGQTGTLSGICKISGLITVNAAGTLTVQFAQNVANGTSSVLVGSHFELRRIA